MTDPNERLDPATHMDTLSLRVFDLATMVEFYTDGVGLVLLSEGGGTLTLGLGDRPVLKLVHAPELRRPPSSAAGLYHSAVLFDSRADLSASLLSIFTSHPHTYTGSADHLVSEAFYFTDPEGNGGVVRRPARELAMGRRPGADGDHLLGPLTVRELPHRS